jgi:hypothetical protein
MTYPEFKEAIIAYIRHALNKTVQVSIHPITKNNHIVLDGLTIMENNCNISPTIYLNYYYDELLAGKQLSVIQEHILQTYHSSKPEENIDVRFYTDYENISDKILFKLIHAKKNEELLKEIPHILYLDLAIVFYCLISTTPTGSATILIHNQHLNFWNIQTNDLYQQALQNTPSHLKAEIKNMNDIMQELLTDAELDDCLEEDSAPMYVLTNNQKLYGAGCILYSDVLSQFAMRLETDLYILPSSVHEVILLPAASNTSVEELNQMVCDVNETQVLSEEVLSDHIYFYSLSKKEILIPNNPS